jgi:hypothetical protein
VGYDDSSTLYAAFKHAMTFGFDRCKLDRFGQFSCVEPDSGLAARLFWQAVAPPLCGLLGKIRVDSCFLPQMPQLAKKLKRLGILQPELVANVPSVDDLSHRDFRRLVVQRP